MRRLARAAKGLRKELANLLTYDMPWSRRVWLYRNEFTTSRGVIYDLTGHSVHNYLSDLQHQRTVRINRDNKDLVENKLVYHLLFSETHPSRIPRVLATVSPGGDISCLNASYGSVGGLLGALDGGRAVIKPKMASGGKEVHVLGRDGDDVLFDGEPTSARNLRQKLSTLPESIVVEFVQQAAYAERIYPDGANTIRVITMVDPETREPFIPAAVHRFGTRRSGYVDNWTAGGLSVAVDTDTGELGKAAASPKQGEFSMETHHPDTDAEITGTVIPGWETVKQAVLDIAGHYGDVLPYAGWDVVVTDADGSVQVIEANSVPDVDLVQTHHPLLADERARRFYEHHGVL